MAGPVGAHAAANLDLMSTLNKHAQQLELMETGACVASRRPHSEYRFLSYSYQFDSKSCRDHIRKKLSNGTTTYESRADHNQSTTPKDPLLFATNIIAVSRSVM